jgi:hypothetical protein
MRTLTCRRWHLMVRHDELCTYEIFRGHPFWRRQERMRPYADTVAFLVVQGSQRHHPTGRLFQDQSTLPARWHASAARDRKGRRYDR